MEPSYTYSHDVQLVDFGIDQVEERGPVDGGRALEAFRAFPYKEQLDLARSLSEPTFPTLSFRSAPDDAVLAVWSLEPDQFEVYMEYAGSKVTVDGLDASAVENHITAFFAGERATLLDRLRAAPSAVSPGGFGAWLRSLFRRW